MSNSATIRIAAALLMRGDGQTLLVRKRGTEAFMQPGGKIERDEPAVHALCREINEELGLQISSDQPVRLGRFSAPAAHEPDCHVDAELFYLAIDDQPVPASEIEEIVWHDPHEDTALTLAPLTKNVVLPLAAKLDGGAPVVAAD